MRAVATDEELMVQLQAGDEGALAVLIDRWRGPLYGFLHRRVPAAASDDLFQETWLRVVRARRRFDPSRRFSTWLFQIANNLCRDRGRRLAADRRKREAYATAESLRNASEGHAPGAALDAAALLSVLSDLQREVVVLRYYQHRSEAETAEILGVPRGTVKSRLHSAIANMKKAVSPETDGA